MSTEQRKMKKMLVTAKSSFGNFASHLLVKRSGRNSKTTLAQKREVSDDTKPQQNSKFTLRVSRSFLAQSAIAIFGLGFIDAGYPLIDSSDIGFHFFKYDLLISYRLFCDLHNADTVETGLGLG